MNNHEYRLVVLADDPEAAARATRDLSEILNEIDGVVRIERTKASADTMDLGAIVDAVCSSGATLAVARGVAAWLRGRRGATVKIERSNSSESIRVFVEGIDPTVASRIVESIGGSFDAKA